MDSKVFRRSLQWTGIGLCLLFAAIYAWQYFYLENQLPDLGKASDFTMQSNVGDKITMSKLDGKVRLVYFFFASCPDVCSPTTKKLANVQSELKKQGYGAADLQLLSITVDPKNDNALKLNEFAVKNGADLDNWSFLSTDFESTKKIANLYKVGVMRDADNRVYHNNQVALVDREGNIRQYYEDSAIQVDQMIKDAKKLLK